ncbi:hypothetical protein AB0N97_33440 [Streptomyces collinus]|uniref:hypothetical protein n=1 Tax=Streptomyces collinus TaxID=42684 RepID=UPI0034201860
MTSCSSSPRSNEPAIPDEPNGSAQPSAETTVATGTHQVEQTSAQPAADRYDTYRAGYPQPAAASHQVGPPPAAGPVALGSPPGGRGGNAAADPRAGPDRSPALFRVPVPIAARQWAAEPASEARGMTE